jgi:hypothetical protein
LNEFWNFLIIWMIWGGIAFLAGWLAHWRATHKQRTTLKRYRQRELARKQVNEPIE